MNRFLSSRIDEDLIFQENVNLINTTEKDGILAIDDTIVEKTGKNIEAAGWIFDHSIGKTVWGIQITTSVVTGDIWYFTKDLVEYLDEKKLDWVFQSKGNRKIKIRGRWITLVRSNHRNWKTKKILKTYLKHGE